MRVLVTSCPNYGHLFPMVPLAWALRNAGHDVLAAVPASGVLRDELAERPSVAQVAETLAGLQADARPALPATV